MPVYAVFHVRAPVLRNAALHAPGALQMSAMVTKGTVDKSTVTGGMVTKGVVTAGAVTKGTVTSPRPCFRRPVKGSNGN